MRMPGMAVGRISIPPLQQSGRIYPATATYGIWTLTAEKHGKDRQRDDDHRGNHADLPELSRKELLRRGWFRNGAGSRSAGGRLRRSSRGSLRYALGLDVGLHDGLGNGCHYSRLVRPRVELL